MQQFDVVVIGGGNAAFCAALSARETVQRVLVLERSPEDEAGGNSRFTAGLMRVAYNGVEDLKRPIPDLSPEEIERTDFGTYTEDQFLDDMARVTEYRCDPDLTEILVKKSLDTVAWMRSKGVRFTAAWGRQAFNINGRFKFWGGLTVEAVGGGPGLVENLTNAAKKNGIEVWYEARATSLIADDDGVKGVKVKYKGKTTEVFAKSVVLAGGGFQANPEMRARYLGPGWELAKVRGTRFNMGEGLKMAMDIGACPYGNWSGRHTTSWERHAPEFGDLSLDHACHRHCYPLSLMINADGKRFVDEGADFYGYTYAKYGEQVFKQPEQFAWQVFDAKTHDMLRPEYLGKVATRVSANTLEELAEKLEGVNPAGFLKTVHEYNAAVKREVAFNPGIKDGKCTVGIEPPKSNWANLLDTAPFEAWHITVGITFTFGGLRIDPDTAQVLDVNMNAIPGLYTAGEMVGGVFYFNYPLGSGLVSGTVFGRIAGTAAAKAVCAGR